MYRVTCAALLAAPWLILASVQTAEATDIDIRGDLKYGPPASVNDTWTGSHIGGGIGLAAFQADLNAEGNRSAVLIGWCCTRPLPSDSYFLSKTTEAPTIRELVLFGADGKAVDRRPGWKRRTA